MSGPWNSLTTLARDEGTGVGFPRDPGAHLKRLHRCRRGNVSLLVLFMGFVFYGLAAMVWNTGQVTSAKIEAQTAADAAAYSSAVWNSRAVNMTTGANMLILRNATAGSAALATVPPMALVWVEWVRYVNQTCAAATGPWVPICWALAWAQLLVTEILPAYVPFMIDAVQGLIELPSLFINIAELHSYQRAWLAAAPDAIEAERQQLEEYFGCEIKLVRGDGAPPGPPLRNGNPLTHLIPFSARIFAELWQNPDSWRNSTEFDLMIIGRARTWWQWVGLPIGYITMWLVSGFQHTVLTTQLGPLEFGPEGLNAWDEFSVIAVARKLEDNTVAGQPPRYPLRFMAPGIFRERVNPVAYAQAETFNGIDGHLSMGPLQYLAGIYPFRVWTTWGWQWQARLNDGDLLPAAAWNAFDLPVGPDVAITAPADLKAVATH
jgi:hypothetical protein